MGGLTSAPAIAETVPGLGSAPASLSSAADACAEQQFWDVPTSSEFCSQIQWLASTGITGGYTDPEQPQPGFHPTAPVSRQAMAAFLHRYGFNGTPDPSCSGPLRLFADVPAGDFCGSIEWLAGAGISGGYADRGFHPGDGVSRQAMAAFLYRFAHPGQTAPGCTTQQFWDVSVSDPFCPQISWLASTELTTGYTDDGHALPGFHPTAVVSRQAMAAFLSRADAQQVVQLNSASPLATVDSVTPGTGSALGGTKVTVTGKHFTGATLVYFDVPGAAVPAGGNTLKVLSDTELTVVTPQHSLAEVSVRVRTPAGLSVPSSATYTYQAAGLTGISGKITSDGGPMEHGGASAYNSNGDAWGVSSTEDGQYLLTGLAPGIYTVCFYGPGSPTDPGYLVECWKDKPGDDHWNGTQVTVTAGEVTPNIDGNLVRAGGIRGKVTSGDGQALKNAWVNVSLLDGTNIESVKTQADGSYRIPSLAVGSYRVCFNGFDLGYRSQCYDGQPPGNIADVTPVAVVAGSFTVLNVALIKA